MKHPLPSQDGPCHKNGTYGGYTFTHEVVRVIEAHDKTYPLFMYIAFQNIHPPLQVLPLPRPLTAAIPMENVSPSSPYSCNPYGECPLQL